MTDAKHIQSLGYAFAALRAGHTALSIYIADDPAKIIGGYGSSVVAESGEIQFSPRIPKG